MEILLVDDDPDIADIVSYSLRRDGHQVLVARDGRQALEIVARSEPDLILLDVMLPYISGFEVCRRIRQRSRVPIILLTARGEEGDKVWGLDLGADDYITKPFSHKELLARVRAVARRARLDEPRGEHGSLTIGELHINFATREVFVGGRLVELTPKEYDLLRCLALNAGRPVTHEVLLNFAWGSGRTEGDTDMLKVHIRHLREKIERNPSAPEYILTVRGVGYRMRRP